MFKYFRKSVSYTIRYNWRLLKQQRVKDYLFLSPKTIIIFAVVLLLNIFFYRKSVQFDIHFISLGNALLTIEVLIRSIVVLLGIIISFTLLSFQVFNKYFGRFAFYDFFKKGHLRIIFTLFILNVIFLMYIQTYLKDCQISEDFDNYAKLIFVEGLLFSFLLVLSIFPIMINLLSKSQSRINLQSLFENITPHEINHFRYFYNDNIDTEEYETNSFKIILEIGLMAIKEFDHTTFHLVVRNIYVKSKTIINGNDHEDFKRNLFYKFRDILKDYFDFAAKEKNTSALQEIVSCRYYIEYEILKKEPPILKDHDFKYAGWDFNFDMERYFDKAIQYNEDAISCSIVDYCRDYLTETVKLKFPKNFIYNYNKPFSEMHYTSIIFRYTSLIKNFHLLAGSLKKTVVLKNIANVYMTLDLSILGSENHKDTKTYLLQINNENKQAYLKSLVESANVKDIDSLLYPFGTALESEVTELNTAIIFKGSLKAFDYVFQRGILNNSIINLLKANAMGFISLHKTEPKASKNLIILSLDKIDYTRGLIAKDDTDERKDIYLKLFRFFGYIKSDYDRSGINDNDLSTKFNELIAKFNFKQEFEDSLEKKGYIQNNGII